MPRLFPEKRFKSRFGTYDMMYAPPATVFLHDLHFQIPTEWRLTVFLPQNVQMYRACCVISIFFTCFRREAPYLFSEYLSFNSSIQIDRDDAGRSRDRIKDDFGTEHTWYHIYRSHRPLFNIISFTVLKLTPGHASTHSSFVSSS